MTDQSSVVAEPAAFVAYLDARLGQHSGSFPQISFACPMCVDRRGDESSKKKFSVNCITGKARCWRCDYAAGAPDQLLRDLNGGKLTEEAKAMLAGEIKVVPVASLYDELLVRHFAFDSTKDKPLKSVKLPQEFIPLDAGRIACWQAFTYMYGRGMTKEEVKLAIEKHKLGFCQTGYFSNRIIFPVYQNGKQVYHTNRYAGKHDLKSLHPKNQEGYISADDVLLGYDAAKGHKVVAIVEGPFSMLACDAAVATLGKRKKLSTAHVKLLRGLVEAGTEEFVLAQDPDAARDSYHLMQGMSGFEVSYLPMSQGTDPFDNRNNMQRLMAERRPMGLSDAISGLHVRMQRPRWRM